jgi:hypothetical protein
MPKSYETELSEKKTIPLDRSWTEVLALEIPADAEEGTYEVGIGNLSTLNCDHRVVLKNGHFLRTISQDVLHPEEWFNDGDEFSTGDEWELEGGMKIVLMARFGNFDSEASEVGAAVEKATLHAKPCWQDGD